MEKGPHKIDSGPVNLNWVNIQTQTHTHTSLLRRKEMFIQLFTSLNRSFYFDSENNTHTHRHTLTGLLRGKEMLPVERTATAGRATFRVQPKGYTKAMDLQTVAEVKQKILHALTRVKLTCQLTWVKLKFLQAVTMVK